ncbi:MAG: hypothetical protein RLZZ175_918 [Bacteroidota bacterium]|jgi:hypothetical protein
MKKLQGNFTTKAIIFVLVAALVGVIIYINSTTIDWYSEYDEEKTTHPYGIKLFKDLVQDNLAEEDKFFTVNKPWRSFMGKAKNATYVFTERGQLYFTDEDKKAFLKFIDEGNNAFIASENFPHELLEDIIPTQIEEIEQEEIDENEEPSEITDSTNTTTYADSTIVDTTVVFEEQEVESPIVEEVIEKTVDSLKKTIKKTHYQNIILSQKQGYLNVYSADNKFKVRYNKINNYKKVNDYFVNSISDSISILSKVKIEILARDEQNHAVYIKIPYGKGGIYLWVNPFVLGNINLIDKHTPQLFSLLFKDFKKGTVYWEKYHKVYHNKNENGDGPNFNNSLSYILSQRELKWAWYILLATGILYLIFNLKRRQKHIEVYKLPENTTEEYLETIARLYKSESGNDAEILQMKINHLFIFIRQTFKITLREDNDEFVNKLHAVAGFDKELIVKLIMHQQMLKNARSLDDKIYFKEVIIDINKFYSHLSKK